jgi:cephalosporin-C deacetylase
MQFFRTSRALLLSLSLGGAVLSVSALSPPSVSPIAEAALRIKLSLSTDAVGGMCALGETVLFTAEVECNKKEARRATLLWEMETLAFEAPVFEAVELEIPPGEKLSVEFPLEMLAPGFVRMICTVTEEGAKRFVKRSRRVGCAPTEVLSELTAEDDLESFWASSLKELEGVNPEYELIQQEVKPGADHELYELLMKSLGGVRVRGWLQLPLSEGPHAAILRVPGYMQNMRPLDMVNGAVILSFNIRGHGESTEDVPGSPADFWVRGLDEKSAYFYRGAYLDCVRAVDYLSSREDVDGDRIAVWGGSQGGGLAFATAALDQRVDLCIADIPWLCDWKNYFELAGKTDDEEINAWLAAKESRTVESTLTTLSYFDTMNLAHLIECPTLMGVGLQDTICPPSTSFATFNRITAPKDFRIYEDAGHGLGREHYGWIFSELAERFTARAR